MRRRRASTLVLATSMAALGINLSSCSWLKRDEPAEYIAVEVQTQRPETPPSVEISYAKPDDTLESVAVSQYTGAAVLRTFGQGDQESSLVRFDGGVPIWQFHSGRSMLNPISVVQKSSYHVTKIEYGKLPSGFVQDEPETGPPPPLYAGGYYIFAITRASAAVSYQAVRVQPDLTLQVYDADPRAGTSFRLCCNVSSDFAEPTPADLQQTDTVPNVVPPVPPPDSDQP